MNFLQHVWNNKLNFFWINTILKVPEIFILFSSVTAIHVVRDVFDHFLSKPQVTKFVLNCIVSFIIQIKFTYFWFIGIGYTVIPHSSSAWEILLYHSTVIVLLTIISFPILTSYSYHFSYIVKVAHFLIIWLMPLYYCLNWNSLPNLLSGIYLFNLLRPFSKNARLTPGKPLGL